MEIYFIKNGVETLINNDYVISMAQSGSLFDNQFKLGATLSKGVSLEIDKRAFENGFDYDSVKIVDKIYTDYILATQSDEGVATLDDYFLKVGEEIDHDVNLNMRVDSCSLEDNKKYNISCYDEMIYLNKQMSYDYTSPKTVLEILGDVCTSHSLTLNSTDLFGGDMVVSWSLDCTERDFVSYVAEINGGYAYINEGVLYIAQFDSTPKQTIKAEDTSGYEIGTVHTIDRVYIELAERTAYYPAATNNETCYLNSDNLLITDLEDGSYTVDSTVRHIFDTINGLTFYNLKIDRCYIQQDIQAGDFIELVENGFSYPTIVSIDTSFCYLWKGGYELELDAAELSDETQVNGTSKDMLKRLQIVVDRNMNTITRKVTEVDEKYGLRCTDIEQTAEDLALTVSKLDGQTISFVFDGDGAHITTNQDKDVNVGTNTLLNDSGFIVRDGTDEVASMSKNSFKTSNWVMEQYEDVDGSGGDVFVIYRGEKK